VKRILAILMACLFMMAAMAVTASVAFADNPHAGNSGHFKGSAGPCDNPNNHPNCPGPH
jgi:hypothetical protein